MKSTWRVIGVPEIRQEFIMMLARPCKQTSGTDWSRGCNVVNKKIPLLLNVLCLISIQCYKHQSILDITSHDRKKHKNNFKIKSFLVMILSLVLSALVLFLSVDLPYRTWIIDAVFINGRSCLGLSRSSVAGPELFLWTIHTSDLLLKAVCFYCLALYWVL